jgi:hypothetical protein
VKKDPRNPLFAEDKAWEARFDNLYANVVREPGTGLYRCWYSPFIVDEAVRTTPRSERKSKPYRALKREMGVCYAESNDGIVWRKPALGIVDFEGSRDNNLVVRGPHGAGVFLDAREPDPARRYKMFFQDKTTSGGFSRDGIRWSDLFPSPPSEPWATRITTLSGRTKFRGTWGSPGCGSGREAAPGRRTESEDFLHWTKAVEVLRADPRAPESQTYAMPIFEYAGVYSACS